MEREVNRAQLLMENWRKKESELLAFGGEKVDKRSLLFQQYRFIGEGLARIYAFPVSGESEYVAILKSAQRATLQELYPNALLRGLVRLKTRLWDRPKTINAFKKLKAENLFKVQQLAKQKGFGAVCGSLESVLDFERNEVELKLSGQVDSSRSLEVAMVLEKDGAGRYELSRFHAALVNGAEKVEYDFVEVGQLDLIKTGNLMMGRSVFMEDGLGGSHWMSLQMDSALGSQLNRFYAEYGFDLAGVLKESALILGKADLKHTKVLEELKSGNAVSVCLSGSIGKLILSADPRSKSISFRNEKGEVLLLNQLVTSLRQNEKLKEKPLSIEPTQAKTIKLNKGRSLGIG